MEVHADKVLGSRGYVIKKAILTDNEIGRIKKDLEVKPIQFGGYEQNVKTFKLYRENEKKLYLPKYYGLKKFGEPIVNNFDKNNKIENIDIKFAGTLRPNQLPVIDAFMEATKTTIGGGLVCLGCGYGKTILALKLVTLIGKKALIVVHKEFLVTQWIERINQFIPEARVGIIQQNKVQVEDKDIVIAMLQSISMKDYPVGTFDSFGFVCIDECHHLGAEVFCKALPKISTRCMLGLSATPDRKDGMRKVFEYYLGGMVFCIRGREREEVKVKIIKYHCQDQRYKKQHVNFKGQTNAPLMINQCCEDPIRLDIVINEIRNAAKEGRKILVLSDRRGHLDEIYEEVVDEKIGEIGYYVGGMKQKDLTASESKQIILGTYTMASEGMDIPSLNCVILATSKGDVEQSVGRILREKKEVRKFVPLIIDIIDQLPNFVRQSYKRIQHYKKAQYTIDYYESFGSKTPLKHSKTDKPLLNNNVSNDDDNENDSDDSITKLCTKAKPCAKVKPCTKAKPCTKVKPKTNSKTKDKTNSKSKENDKSNDVCMID